jgi:anti-sigma factor RsiW
MDCERATTHLSDLRRDRLDAELRAELEAHLASCERCRAEAEADAALDAALARLPRRAAPRALTSALLARWGEAPRASPPRRGWIAILAAAVVVVIIAMVASRRSAERAMAKDAKDESALATEAVNDHLRVLYSERPLEVESGGVHQVKPWFSGRLDFAPVVRFGGDDEFPLQGGSVAYFVDRKAAAYQFKRRLHPITLLVFRADGLPWAPAPHRETQRGFHVRLWRDGDLGYALVSDVDERDLDALAQRLAAPR